MIPCHLLIRLFVRGQWQLTMWLGQIYLLILFYSFFYSLVWVKSLPKMIFLFLLCVWFCSYSRSWPPCPCHWPHPDRYHWLGPHSASLTCPLYNLSICFPTIHMFPFYSNLFHFIIVLFSVIFPSLVWTEAQPPSLQPFNLPSSTCVLFCSPCTMCFIIYHCTTD